MAKQKPDRVFIIHGWGGRPEEDWLPWLKDQLELNGFEVVVPAMPDSMEPHIWTWVPKLKELVGTPDERTFFVGHSMGTQTILRYLESLPEKIKVGGVVLVAGFIHLTDNILETEKDKKIAKPWLEKDLDWKKILSHTKSFVTIFSDDDPFVPLEDSETFMENLNAEVIIERKKGHMSMNENIYEFPEVLEAVMNMSSWDK
jgi:predicted alpha/beta hydrolase family esterase